MARFPIQYTEASPSGRAASPRANIDVSTGEGAVGAAAAGLGGTIMDLGIKWDLKEANTQFSEYKRKVELDDAARKIEIDSELDQSKHDAIFQSHAETHRGFLPKNKRAMEAAVIWNNQRAGEQAEILNAGKKLRVEDNFEAEVFKNITVVSTTGSPSIYANTAQMLKRGYIIDSNNPDEQGRPLDKTVYNKLKTSLDVAFATGQVNTLIQGGKYDEAEALIGKSNLTTDQKIALSNDIKHFKSAIEDSFANHLHDSFIEADSGDLSTQDARAKADALRNEVTGNPQLDGVTKTRMLNAIRTWEKDEGSINFAVINSLNQRIDQFIQSGVADLTLKQDIVNAKLDGSFGSRKGMISRGSAAMQKRLEAAEYKVNYASVISVKADLKTDLRRSNLSEEQAQQVLFLFDKDMRELLSSDKGKGMNDAEVMLMAQQKANAYRNTTKKEVEGLIGQKAEGQQIVMWSEQSRKQQETDILRLTKVDTSGWWFFEKPKKAKVFEGWTIEDVKKAKSLMKGKGQVDDTVIQEFSRYLAKKEKGQFKAVEREVPEEDLSKMTDEELLRRIMK